MGYLEVLSARSLNKYSLNGLTCATSLLRWNPHTTMSLAKPQKNKGSEPVDLSPPDEIIFGRSAAMEELRRRATNVGGTNVLIWLDGEGGTGKDDIARRIHKHARTCN